jgi:hypothetical protein
VAIYTIFNRAGIAEFRLDNRSKPSADKTEKPLLGYLLTDAHTLGAIDALTLVALNRLKSRFDKAWVEFAPNLFRIGPKKICVAYKFTLGVIVTATFKAAFRLQYGRFWRKPKIYFGKIALALCRRTMRHRGAFNAGKLRVIFFCNLTLGNYRR